MPQTIPLDRLDGPRLALWAAKAARIEQQQSIQLFADNSGLYRKIGAGALPYFYRPDLESRDTELLIAEMKQAGGLFVSAEGATFKAEGFGEVTFSGTQAVAVTRCYIAWKLGKDLKVPWS